MNNIENKKGSFIPTLIVVIFLSLVLPSIMVAFIVLTGQDKKPVNI